MQRQESSEINPLPAEQVRVTPQELAAAIVELQARKEGQSGTIAIGDAVHELSLDESPADILRQVEAQRIQVRKRKKKRKNRIASVLAALVFVSAGIAWRVFHVSSAPTPTPPVSAAPAEMLSLSSVPDEQQVYADQPALTQIFQNAPASKIMVHRSQAPLHWGLIKHHGKWYLQAFTEPTTETKLKIGAIALYNDSPIGYLTDEGNGQLNYNCITLPITGMRYQDSQETEHAAGIIVSHVHPDSYLWEAGL